MTPRDQPEPGPHDASTANDGAGDVLPEPSRQTGQEVRKVSPLVAVTRALSADLFLFSAPIAENSVAEFIRQVPRSPLRPNVGLILTTFGGDPDMAYRMARLLKRRYKKFTLYVLGECKSAGTLVALGADELVMSEDGELGPLDVQTFKQDEISTVGSGLDIFKALDVLSQQAFSIFDQHFISIIRRSGGNISTKTAADIARHVAPQLLAPIAGQIDPIRLGELQRAVSIAKSYGERLGADPLSVNRLIYNYPSHSFIIDLDEAEELFRSVRVPTEAEWQLECDLRRVTESQHGRDCLAQQHDEGFSSYLNPLASVPDGSEPTHDAHAITPTEPATNDQVRPLSSPGAADGPGRGTPEGVQRGGGNRESDQSGDEHTVDRALTLALLQPVAAGAANDRRNGSRRHLSVN